MANYYAYVRINYFHVKDAAAFREFIASIGSTEGDKVELIEGKDKEGNPIFGFGCHGQPAFPEADSYEGILESLSELVADDDAVIIMEIGHEKLNYLAGEARIITSKEAKCITIADQAIQTAREMLGEAKWETKTEY